jgi:hypothetical protein
MEAQWTRRWEHPWPNRLTYVRWRIEFRAYLWDETHLYTMLSVTVFVDTEYVYMPVCKCGADRFRGDQTKPQRKDFKVAT